MKFFEKIDNILKGAKTYLASAFGLVVVAFLQSKGVDAVGVIDGAITLLDNATVQAAAVWAFGQSFLRKIAKRGSA
jgi:hypothetical protein